MRNIARVGRSLEMDSKLSLSPSKVQKAREAIDFLSSLSDAGPSGASNAVPRSTNATRVPPPKEEPSPFATSDQKGKFCLLFSL